MYENLRNALKAKGISHNAAAAAIGMPEPTFRGKMTIEDRSFSIEEAIRIKINLFPEMDMMYLFQREETTKPA
ncbi:MAG: DNA-binding protein [Ruminococcus sp.]|nr:DNA-binding protein [Ruminococcus sp.]